MERHGLRCYLICLRLASLRGAEVDRELLLVAALLHDIGLYDGASEGGVYVSDGAVYAERLLAGREAWPAERVRRCLDAIERHHELRSQWAAGLEVELLRRADLVDVSAGLISHGAGRAWLRELGRCVRRDGTYREIGGLVLKPCASARRRCRGSSCAEADRARAGRRGSAQSRSRLERNSSASLHEPGGTCR